MPDHQAENRTARRVPRRTARLDCRPAADRRASARRLQRGEVRGRGLLAQCPEGGDGGEMPRPGPDLARFPVVDRLRRRAHEQAAFGRRQPEPPALREQALGAEPGTPRSGLGLGRRRRLRAGTAQAAQLLLERLRAALQRGDVRAMAAQRFLEGQAFAPQFLAGDPGDLVLEEGGNVRHGCDCAAVPASARRPRPGRGYRRRIGGELPSTNGDDRASCASSAARCAPPGGCAKPSARPSDRAR